MTGLGHLSRAALIGAWVFGFVAAGPMAPTVSSAADARASVLVIGAEGTIPPLDPHRLTGTVGLRIIDAIYDPLVRDELTRETKAAPALKPGLAASWTSSPDSKTFTFKLREGVTFHDGTPLDAAAVKANFDRLMNKDSPIFDQRASGAMVFLTRWVASIATPDARTVVMNLKEPFAGLPRLLTERRMAIVSPKALEQHNGDALAANPVGTGPFVLDKIVQGQQVELKRNDRFWGGTPKVERIIFRQIVDPTALAIAMQTGEVDLIPSASSQQVDQLRRRKGMTVQYTDPANQYYLRLNTRIAPTDNPAVRRALNYAVNRAAIAKLVGGQVAPVGGPVPAGNEMSGLGAASPYGHNPQGAKELLASAGISGPLKLKLLVPVSGPGLAQAPQIAALIQQDLKAVGITLETQFMEFTAMIAAESPGYKDDVHGSLNGWVTGADSAYFLERMFSGGQQPPRGVNRGWYNNAQVDGLFELARGEVDEAKRNEFYKLAADRIAADAPWVFLHQDRLPRIYRDRVTGLVPAASVYFDYPTIGLR